MVKNETLAGAEAVESMRKKSDMAIVAKKLANKAAGVATDSVERSPWPRGIGEDKARAEHRVGEPVRSELERIWNRIAVIYSR